MYIIVLLILLGAVGLAVGFSPLLAVVVALPLFVLFLAYVGLSRRPDQPGEGEDTPAAAVDTPEDEHEHDGLWGQRTE